MLGYSIYSTLNYFWYFKLTGCAIFGLRLPIGEVIITLSNLFTVIIHYLLRVATTKLWLYLEGLVRLKFNDIKNLLSLVGTILSSDKMLWELSQNEMVKITIIVLLLSPSLSLLLSLILFLFYHCNNVASITVLYIIIMNMFTMKFEYKL